MADETDEAKVAAENPAWDVTTDPSNPQPRAWPVCDACGEAYSYQQAIHMTKGLIWVWGRTCKKAACKKAGAHLVGPAMEQADDEAEVSTG